MDDLNVIDEFTATFSNYIDQGFGLLEGDVGFLTATLIGVDIALAGVFWALAGEENVMARFLKKVLYVGAFAFIINNFKLLSEIIFSSFAALGLKASGSTIAASDLLKPGFVAAAGYEGAFPLLEEANSLLGFPSFFDNFVTIAIIILAWVIVLFAFFILAIQLFVAIIEFKLTTLAGFILVPFALWNKTSFLAERVLGNVVASGVKLMVLAVIVGVGSTIFGTVTAAFAPGGVTLEQAAATILASLSLLALGVFGPAIATGLVSGAPQLGAGAAVGTAAAAGAGFAAAGLAAASAGRAGVAGGQGAIRAGARLAGGASSAFALSRAASGRSGIAGAAAGVSGALQSGAASALRSMGASASRVLGEPGAAFEAGASAPFRSSRATAQPEAPRSREAPPEWANALRRGQSLRDAARTGVHFISSGDRGGGADGPNLREE